MVTAQLVKELREKTGAGMMDCKKVLMETNGDMERAAELLREKGITKAAKKSDRIAAEGLVYCYLSDDKKVGVVLEVNAETDFVAKNAEFIELTNNLAEFVAVSNPSDVDALLSSTCPKCGKVVSDVIKEKIASIGEKITVRRFVRYEGNTATYIHNGKIGVLLETSESNPELAKDICLHIASSAPEFVSRADIPASVIEEETRIEMGKEDLANKPEQIRSKIVEGRVNKLMAQRCLIEQPFVKNPDQTIEQLISGKFSSVKFDRFVLGEGLEKRNENFADEVMSQLSK